MKKFLILIVMLWSTSLLARPDTAQHGSPYLVNHLFENLRIVLHTELECDAMPGKKASAQRIDGMYIPGCWDFEQGNESLIRINWIKGDFSILPLKDFIPADQLAQ